MFGATFGDPVRRGEHKGLYHQLSVYFTDPNGIALEASWWVVDGTGKEYAPTDQRLFQDPNPVPAVAELTAERETWWGDYDADGRFCAKGVGYSAYH